MGPFVIAGALETLGILLGIVALSIGQVVVVSPITLRTLCGAVCVVAGTIAISIVR